MQAAVMLNHDVSGIATFDKDFDRISEITRIDL